MEDVTNEMAEQMVRVSKNEPIIYAASILILGTIIRLIYRRLKKRNAKIFFWIIGVLVTLSLIFSRAMPEGIAYRYFTSALGGVFFGYGMSLFEYFSDRKKKK